MSEPAEAGSHHKHTEALLQSIKVFVDLGKMDQPRHISKYQYTFPQQ